MFHTAFGFGLQYDLIESIYRGDAGWLTWSWGNHMEKMRSYHGNVDMATFLYNHDFSDGGRAATKFAEEPRKNRLATSLLLTLPGVPYIYYGEELGMPVSELKVRDPSIRTYMPWQTGMSFSPDVKRPYVILDPSVDEINVAKQEQEQNSMLNFYRHWIKLRKNHPALRLGRYRSLPHDSKDDVFAFERSLAEENLWVVANFKGGNREVSIDSDMDSSSAIEGLERGGDYSYDEKLRKLKVFLKPYEVRIFEKK
jgi:glycosidase